MILILMHLDLYILLVSAKDIFLKLKAIWSLGLVIVTSLCKSKSSVNPQRLKWWSCFKSLCGAWVFRWLCWSVFCCTDWFIESKYSSSPVCLLWPKWLRLDPALVSLLKFDNVSTAFISWYFCWVRERLQRKLKETIKNINGNRVIWRRSTMQFADFFFRK